MTAKTISVTELKQNLGEIVNEASFGGTRFILLSHGKERAALISVEDLRLLEKLLAESQRELYQTQQQNLLADARQLRESAAEASYNVDAVLEEVREERPDDLTDLR
ncbi:MAG: type II toxin-antitoxin system Phd/YefM family antitoxin [Candidatus Promineifilaceae bacterium]|nr:type II toxin-antitoxin system Phd/YefM family antitoxin [Anaerolineaceae bacterium]